MEWGLVVPGWIMSIVFRLISDRQMRTGSPRHVMRIVLSLISDRQMGTASPHSVNHPGNQGFT